MSTSTRKSSSQSRIPILPASLGPAWGMTPTGSALLTPRTKTYVAVVRGGLDIRVGGRRSRVQLKAAERSEQEKVLPKNLKSLQKEASEMFPAFGRDKWRTPPPSRERMEKESRAAGRGLALDPGASTLALAGMSRSHAQGAQAARREQSAATPARSASQELRSRSRLS